MANRAALAAITLASAAAIGLIARDRHWLSRMPKLHEQPGCEPASPDWVSVVVPARDEARNIARCLDGLVAQRYPRYEIVVVDDGSTDDTPAILAGYAARYPGLVRVVPGRPLPPGWVGKCNACMHGSTFARGEWILFVDADTWPQPDLLCAMLREAQERRLDALSLMPFNELGSAAEKAILPVFFQFAWTVFPLAKAADPEMPPRNALAIGQCFMFRSSVYRALGGHAIVKDKVLEDVEFAHALRRAGYRLGLARAPEHIRVRMYHNYGEVARGLAKHASAGRRAGGWRAYWGVLHLILTTLAPPALAAAGVLGMARRPTVTSVGAAAVALAGYAASWSFWRCALAKLYALPARWAWAMPAGLLAYLAIVARGTASSALKRGVSWKGRSYP